MLTRRRRMDCRIILHGDGAELVIGPATSGRARWRLLSGNDDFYASA